MEIKLHITVPFEELEEKYGKANTKFVELLYEVQMNMDRMDNINIPGINLDKQYATLYWLSLISRKISMPEEVYKNGKLIVDNKSIEGFEEQLEDINDTLNRKLQELVRSPLVSVDFDSLQENINTFDIVIDSLLRMVNLMYRNNVSLPSREFEKPFTLEIKDGENIIHAKEEANLIPLNEWMSANENYEDPECSNTTRVEVAQ